MQSLIVARKETAVATFTVIHRGFLLSGVCTLPLHLLVPLFPENAKCFCKFFSGFIIAWVLMDCKSCILLYSGIFYAILFTDILSP